MLIEVVRPYGGAEGKRVKIGRRFWVQTPKTKAPPGVQEITQTRYAALKNMRLVVPVTAASAPAPKAKPDRAPGSKPAPAPRAAPAPAPLSKVEPDSKPPAAPAPGARSAAKAQVQKTKASAASRPGGQPSAEGGQQSSSQAGRPTKPSTLKQRGVRRGDSPPSGLPSTTPGDSPPGQPSSTDATPAGGGTTAAVPDSTAFD